MLRPDQEGPARVVLSCETKSAPIVSPEPAPPAPDPPAPARPAMIRVVATPPEAAIYIGDELAGRGELARAGSAPVAVRAELAGWTSASGTARPGTTLRLALERVPTGCVNLSFVELQVAEVSIGARQLGTVERGDVVGYELPAGEHTVRATNAATGRSESHTVTVAPGPVVRHRRALRPRLVRGAPVQMPGATNAFIPAGKIDAHLLCISHPVGRAKARFFLARGWRREAPEEFERDLLRHAIGGEVLDRELEEFGVKYVVRGAVATPRGTMVRLRTVWIDEGEGRPRLVNRVSGQAMIKEDSQWLRLMRGRWSCSSDRSQNMALNAATSAPSSTRIQVARDSRSSSCVGTARRSPVLTARAGDVRLMGRGEILHVRHHAA